MKLPAYKQLSLMIAVILITGVICSLLISTYMQDSEAHISPGYPKINIKPILLKDELSDEDYKILYFQTGLGRPAIEDLKMVSLDFQKAMLSFQKNFFKGVRITSEKNTIISKEEFVVDKEGNKTDGTELSPIQNGDILITKSSRTYGWRNGHAALMVDEDRGTVLECAVLGTDSCLANISKWTKYPNFMVFRLRDASRELRNEIAVSAIENLKSVPYSLTVGIFSPKFKKAGEINKTNCSHLVWQAFMLFGYDLDSDRSMIVTPKDIANSPLLEVVQVFGVNPENPWP